MLHRAMRVTLSDAPPRVHPAYVDACARELQWWHAFLPSVGEGILFMSFVTLNSQAEVACRHLVGRCTEMLSALFALSPTHYRDTPAHARPPTLATAASSLQRSLNDTLRVVEAAGGASRAATGGVLEALGAAHQLLGLASSMGPFDEPEANWLRELRYQVHRAYVAFPGITPGVPWPRTASDFLRDAHGHSLRHEAPTIRAGLARLRRDWLAPSFDLGLELAFWKGEVQWFTALMAALLRSGEPARPDLDALRSAVRDIRQAVEELQLRLMGPGTHRLPAPPPAPLPPAPCAPPPAARPPSAHAPVAPLAPVRMPPNSGGVFAPLSDRLAGTRASWTAHEPLLRTAIGAEDVGGEPEHPPDPAPAPLAALARPLARTVGTQTPAGHDSHFVPRQRLCAAPPEVAAPCSRTGPRASSWPPSPPALLRGGHT